MTCNYRITVHPLEDALMRKSIMKLFGDRSGATAIEYGLIAALIAVAIIAGVTAVGTQLQATFTAVSAALPGAAAPATPGA
jgi:pilus assembly protein Flp/PilA